MNCVTAFYLYLRNENLMTSFDKQKLSDLKIAVFDLETTGLCSVKNRIIQMSLVFIENAEINDKGREWLVNPGDDHEISRFILNLTKLSEVEIRRSLTIDKILPIFSSAVGECIVAGHNIERFDLKFINEAKKKYYIDVQAVHFIDTLHLSRRLKPRQKNHKLATCVEAYGIPFPEHLRHNALHDTHVCAQLLVHQIKELSEKGIHSYGEMKRFLKKSRK
jgi:DNA polymerase III subunit epsilon